MAPFGAMALGFGSRMGAGLEAELKRATYASTIEVPQDAMLAIMQASQNCEDRREIMHHLHGCLTSNSSSLWRRVYLGLLVLEELLQKGSAEVVIETGNGIHFDLMQRLNFLEAFEYSYDLRVQHLVRQKASIVKSAWTQRQLALENEEEPPPSKSWNLPVSLKHNDDTTDESGDDTSSRPKAATTAKASGSQPRKRQEASDGSASAQAAPSQSAPSQSAAPPLDLFGDDSSPGQQQQPSPAAAPAKPASTDVACIDLLGEEMPADPPTSGAAVADLL